MTAGAGTGSPGVLVIGGGVAGAGAAFAASRAGARVALLDGGTGASTLSTGAIDFGGADRADGGASVAAFVEASEAYVLSTGGAPARVATTSGVVRDAAGRDRSVLDLSAARGARIGVVACDRPGWDARALARAWGAACVPLDAALLRHEGERSLPDADFAARHDDAARLGWLAERLREALARHGPFGAVVLPPCLGVERPRAPALSELVDVPCGEATGLPGGPAGLRFEAARDRLLSAAGVERLHAWASAVDRTARGWRVVTDGRVLEAGAVVVATGGLLGGGLAYRRSDGSAAPVAPFALTLASPLVVGARGRRLEAASAAFGHAPESLAWPWAFDPLLERAGALVDRGGRAAEPGLFAAGDVIADRPRTWLEALASGLRAGTSAACAAASPTPP